MGSVFGVKQRAARRDYCVRLRLSHKSRRSALVREADSNESFYGLARRLRDKSVAAKRALQPRRRYMRQSRLEALLVSMKEGGLSRCDGVICGLLRAEPAVEGVKNRRARRGHPQGGPRAERRRRLTAAVAVD